MARIEGVNLPESKRVEYGLTYIRGIGLFRSRQILGRLGINIDKRIRELSTEEVAAIQRDINAHYKVGGELQTEIAGNIRMLQEIGCYRGLRHKKGLPVRGQRTKTNARTRKGPRKAGSTIALKRKITKK
jgi:small subunit ribosomal protein S13